MPIEATIAENARQEFDAMPCACRKFDGPSKKVSILSQQTQLQDRFDGDEKMAVTRFKTCCQVCGHCDNALAYSFVSKELVDV